MSTNKCPNCKARDHRGQYCPPCAAIYRKVRRFQGRVGNGEVVLRQNTPAGFVFFVLDPEEEVVQWLTKRGKMPDMVALRDKALRLTLESIVRTPA